MLALRRRFQPSLRSINRALTAVVALLALYIIFAPFMPEFTWWARHDAPLVHVAPKVVTRSVKQTMPAGEVLSIPSIDMTETVHEGGMISLRYGVWHLPYTSTPAKGGNTVFVGHRFTYANPKGVFYYLDKIKVGDPIMLYWNGTEYDYKVTSTSIVPPTDVAVENPTASPRLTLYTCTPLWTATNRLIIVAEPMEKQA